MALNRGDDWWKLLGLPPDEFAIANAVVKEAQRRHIEEVQAIADRTATQTANNLGPQLGKLLRSLAKSMRS